MAYCSQAHRLRASSFSGHQTPCLFRATTTPYLQYVLWRIAIRHTVCGQVRLLGINSLPFRAQDLWRIAVRPTVNSLPFGAQDQHGWAFFFSWWDYGLLGVLNSIHICNTVYGVLQSGTQTVGVLVFWASTPCLLESYDLSAKRSMAQYYSSAKRSVAYCSQVLRLWASSFFWTSTPCLLEPYDSREDQRGWAVSLACWDYGLFGVLHSTTTPRQQNSLWRPTLLQQLMVWNTTPYLQTVNGDQCYCSS